MSKSKMGLMGSMLLTALAALGYGVATAAETAEPTSTPSESKSSLEEIVVTARRREENLQNVPISITALSGDQLQQQGVVSINDLRTLSPGVNIAGQNRDDSSFYVRGTSVLIQVGQDNQPSTATYFAEVPSNASGPGAFFDMDSVQILKGPQGTLFGRNTTGGAVLFEPQRPQNLNDGYIEITGGNYDLRQAEGAVNWAAIPDVVALRVAGTISRRDGFTTSIVTGQRLDDRNFDSFRVSLLLTPVDGLESETIADHRYRSTNGNSQVVRAFDPSSNLGGTVATNPALAPLEGLGAFAGLTPAQVGSIPLTVGGGASVGCLGGALPGCPAPLRLPPPYAAYGGVAAALAAAYAGGGLAVVAPTSQLNAILATQAAIGVRQTQIPDVLKDRQLDEGITNRTKYDVTDDLTLKNIIAFRRQRTNQATDDDGVPLPFLVGPYAPQNWSFGQDQFSEEFQVQGRAPSLDLNYIVGLYHETSSPGFQQNIPATTLGSIETRLPDNDDKSDAVFGHLEWNPLSYLGFSGGVRETADRRYASLSVVGPTGGCIQIDFTTGNIACPLAITRDFHATSWDFTVNWHPTEGTLMYARVARGYKGGGINLPAPPSGATYQPETVDSHEIGVKSDLSVRDMPVRIDAAVFYDNYNDMQQEVAASFAAGNGSFISTSIIENVPHSLNKGVEFSATVLPVRGLSFGPWFSYLRSYSQDTIAGELTAYRQLPYQPKWKYGLTGQYSYLLPANEGNVVLTADWSWQDWVYDAPTPGIIPTYPSYGLLNARLQWQNIKQTHIDLTLFATNLLDKVYVQGGFPIMALGYDSVFYGEPRMYGGSIRYRFGGKD